MKKVICGFIIVLSLFLIDVNVYARQAEGTDGAGASGATSGGNKVPNSDVTISGGDYELICTYDDGSELTITKNKVYYTKNSQDTNSSIDNYQFYATNDQKNAVDSEGKVTEYKHDKITSNGQCPSKLYAYLVPAKYNDDDEEIDMIYYATSNSIAGEFGTHTKKTGFLKLKKKQENNATYLEGEDAKLVSEEVNLMSTKKVLICDYITKKTEAISSQENATFYLYNNIGFIEVGGRVSSVRNQTKCPSVSESKPIYINDANPRQVGTGGYGLKLEYDVIRYSSTTSADTCKNTHNNGKECSKFYFLGYRTDDSDSLTGEDVCELLGNRTIIILKDIVSWMQIIVPAFVIVLIGIDIAKMVLAGNLEEELPKKKKSIIVRLIIMVIFFFLPLIAGVIISLLKESGVNIGDIECFFR